MIITGQTEWKDKLHNDEEGGHTKRNIGRTQGESSRISYVGPKG